MKAASARRGIPVIRVAQLRPYVSYLESQGAPVGRLLTRAGIPPELLERPLAAISLQRASDFAEMACRMIGSEHFGLYAALGSGLEDLGAYGHRLLAALTLRQYFAEGIELFNTVDTGHRVWISGHRDELRFNVESAEPGGLGHYQSHVFIIALTVASCRRAAAPQWAPREVGFAYACRERFPATDLLEGARIVRGCRHSYMTIPRRMMAARFPGWRICERNAERSIAARLPGEPLDLARHQIAALSSLGAISIDLVAESLGFSKRALQREIGKHGLTYSLLLEQHRLGKAADWLQSSDKAITEIAFDLGYSDASNFTRAFRRCTGVSPKAYRCSFRSS